MENSYIGIKGEYKPIRRLGAGGNGEVWLASGPECEVALKLLKKRAPGDGPARFKREIMALQRLEGIGGVLPLLDSPANSEDSPRQWFVMPVAKVLREYISQDAALQDICECIACLARALAAVHAVGVVHRDIKPDNLYFYNDSWCLGDFGLADFADAEPLTRAGRKLGPAYFIAPEMLNDPAKADGRPADVYSLAKTLWVLATGQNFPAPGVHDPTYSETSIRSYRHDYRSAALDNLLMRMTSNDPSTRPIAAQVAAELEVLSREQTMSEPPDPTSALDRLRAALTSHFGERERSEYQLRLARESASVVKERVDSIARLIMDKTSLGAEGWYSVPTYWGHRSNMATAQVVWEDTGGWQFEVVVNSFGFRLCLGFRIQLLSDNNLVATVGYHYDRLVNGRVSNNVGVPGGWTKKVGGVNGSGAAESGVQDLLSQMEEQFPKEVDRYRELVEQL